MVHSLFRNSIQVGKEERRVNRTENGLYGGALQEHLWCLASVLSCSKIIAGSDSGNVSRSWGAVSNS